MLVLFKITYDKGLNFKLKIENINELKKIANNLRIDIVNQIYWAQSGHPGGALSIADIMAVLFFYQMNIESDNPNWYERDRLVLSKGHSSSALYAALAERGFIEKEELKSFRKINSRLQGHPDCNKLPGVDMTGGSLGQGLSIANGMAIASKLNKLKNRIYCILGDGECEEGQIWEAAMSASKYHLDNLWVILDNNNLQIDGTIREVKAVSLLEEKWKSFGFFVEKCNGNSIEELVETFNKLKNINGKPAIIICNTVKGKGVSFMENKVSWHGKAPNEEQYNLAMEEINSKF